MHKVQLHLLESCPDNTDALINLISAYDTLISNYGVDEEDLNDHMEVSAFYVLRLRQSLILKTRFNRSTKLSNPKEKIKW